MSETKTQIPDFIEKLMTMMEVFYLIYSGLSRSN